MTAVDTHADHRDSRKDPAAPGHGLGAGRHLPHGLGPAISRGSPGPSRHRRRLLDRCHAGHQSPVPRLRSGYRSRHRGGDQTRSEGLSRRAAAHAQGGITRVQPAGPSGRSPGLEPMVGLRVRGDLAPALRTRLVDQGVGRSSGGACRISGCRGLCPLGQQGSADGSRVEVRRPRRPDGAEFAWGDELMPGGRPMANTWQGGTVKLAGSEPMAGSRA